MTTPFAPLEILMDPDMAPALREELKHWKVTIELPDGTKYVKHAEK